MPIYVMQCTGECNKAFEFKLSIKDKLPNKCVCGGKLKSVLCPPLIVYKAGGFHCTDYGSDGLKGTLGKE